MTPLVEKGHLGVGLAANSVNWSTSTGVPFAIGPQLQLNTI